MIMEMVRIVYGGKERWVIIIEMIKKRRRRDLKVSVSPSGF